MAKEVIEVSVWRTRVDGGTPDGDERGVAAGDWRDPDVVLKLDGARVYPADQNERGASEPDWQKSWELRWGDRNFVEIPPNRPINPVTRMYFRGDCRPPDIIVEAWKSGSTLEGVVVVRDTQRHGI
jgi:hypothetical protein